MARTGEKMTEPTQPNELKDEKEGISIWSTILSQVQASSPNKLPSCKLVLILGDDECGKTSLIAKLQGNEDPKKGSGLEYHYILVRDEYRDDHTQLGVWILDGDPWHRNLLKYVVNEVSFPHITVLLAASMTQPWNILESLEKWAMILEENLDRLKLDSDLVKEFKQKTLKRFQEYLEPRDEIENVTSLKKGSGSEEETISLPLDEITLTCNVGLDVIVVVTKTDFMSTLEKDYDYKDEHFDFIQQALRKFCLKFGASLVYTSVKEDKNCDLLYKYLVHKIYSFPFKTPALLVEKDSVFIPSGWDNKNKISILYENLKSVTPDDVYSDFIVNPTIRKPVQREGEIAAEEDQTFLLKQQNLLNQQLSTSVRSQESSMRTPSGAEKTSDRRLSGTTTVQNSPRKIDGPDAVAGSEGVLQNFFNSLLNRKTGPGASSSSASLQSPEKVSVRNDAVAELDRMMRLKKPLAPNQSNNIDNLMNASPGDTGPSSSPQM
ncbi:cytoplasmic dynein 1 light intermediate chain 2-like isoform X1 [Limulus polyphemus]|uniref:Dynein light intermediate chain n=1 Tax=Limulus polyphemus TaxID=6850 RepID=A0ABM1S4M5_LIMPO|nr:cytoplasmic dynein 1 light intermediate chain 2-like isoform X1 [Limulus polyphemus]